MKRRHSDEYPNSSIKKPKVSTHGEPDMTAYVQNTLKTILFNPSQFRMTRGMHTTLTDFFTTHPFERVKFFITLPDKDQQYYLNMFDNKDNSLPYTQHVNRVAGLLVGLAVCNSATTENAYIYDKERQFMISRRMTPLCCLAIATYKMTSGTADIAALIGAYLVEFRISEAVCKAIMKDWQGLFFGNAKQNDPALTSSK